MKKCVLFLMLIVTSASLFAQNKQVDQFFSKYEGKKGYTSVMVSEKLFELVASAAPASERDIKEMVGELKGIRVLVYEQEDAPAVSHALYQEALSVINTADFEELLTVYDAGEQVRMLVKQDDANKNIVSELLILVSGEEFVMVDIFGHIDLNKISRLTDNLQLDGLDELKNLDK
ncbi:MAG: DUF4252 domain-containing protein [Chitinophagales bacterium]